MSLTSYRTAPPRVSVFVGAGVFVGFVDLVLRGWFCRFGLVWFDLIFPSKTWRRPTLPRLKTQYHRR